MPVIFTFNPYQEWWCLGVLVADSAFKALAAAWVVLMVIQGTLRPHQAQKMLEAWKSLRYCGTIKKDAEDLSLLILLKENSLCRTEKHSHEWSSPLRFLFSSYPISWVMSEAYCTPFTTHIPFFTWVFIHEFAWQKCVTLSMALCVEYELWPSPWVEHILAERQRRMKNKQKNTPGMVTAIHTGNNTKKLTNMLKEMSFEEF